ncbi:hypothetical protein [Xenorhabdus ishibashii]|uniref:Uncharacterized protein n=1 Tax=Xenorhabdus ishibashii TaxID=1034471 RepID=A0A2D0K9J0_9GAMM|nr:hypothetical protein [Xenorhabdus ishibashii]PHM60124.1 hypothetical protein Xish_03267 [Xenorhabdus ishibashii]
MSIKNSLTAPFLPQSSNGIIDESELSQSVLVVVVNQYEKAHIGDYIIVHLNGDVNISSKPFYIIEENIHLPNYEIIIPFSDIPLGSYDVFYTVTDWTGNPVSSVTSRVTIKKSDSPQQPIEATLIITGYQQVGDNYAILTIQIHDTKTSEQIKNTAISYKIEQAINISSVLDIGGDPETIQSMTTDDYGQFKMNLKGQEGGNCIIRVTANNHVGSIKYFMELY